MSRRVIFVGPNYPPESIMRVLIGLSINICDRASITTEGDKQGDYITNLVIENNAVSFTVVCTNPVTGEVATLQSSSPLVKTVLKPGGILPPFNGGDTAYGISPCCVTMAYQEDVEDITDIKIFCADPIQTSLVGNTLKIDVNDALTIVSPPEEEPINGVVSINGISTRNGGINIRGVGSVTVAITGADE